MNELPGKRALAVLALALALAPLSSAFADPPMASTNDTNRTNGWAHVDQLATGSHDFEFISTRAFYSCFEYRTDGDTSQKIAENNYNTLVTDGLYPYYCQNNNSRTETISANGYVEIRMVFGAEADERFDWTRFDVLPPPPAYSCVGFEPPADNDIFVKKPNRVLPLRMALMDGDAMIVWDITPPVMNVSYVADGGDAVDLTEELTFAGRGDEGNQFMFNGSKWAFNSSLKGLAPGEYTITAVPGSVDYVIDPTCEVVLTIQ